MQSLYNRENHEKRSAIGEWRRQHLHGSLSSESLRTALAAPTVILRWITAPPPPEHILIAASQMLVRAEHDDDDDDDDHWMASQLSSAGSANLRPLDPATDEADMADSASTSVRSNAAAGPLASPLDVGQLSQQDAGLLIRALADVLRSEEAPLVFRVSAVRALARHAVDAHEADDATSFDASTGAAATSASAAAAPDADAEEMIEAARADEPLAPIEHLLAAGVVSAWCMLCGSAAHPLALRAEAARALAKLVACCAGGVEALSLCGAAPLVSLLVSQVGWVTADRAAYDATGHALKVLANLCGECGDSETLRELTSDDCLTALMLAVAHGNDAVSGDDGMSGTAGWLLCLLCTEAATAATALGHPAMLQALLLHGRSDSATAQEELGWAIAALSSDEQHVSRLAGFVSCHELLVELLQRRCASVRLQAAWALANLALHPLAQQQLADRPTMVADLMNAVRLGLAEAAVTNDAQQKGVDEMEARVLEEMADEPDWVRALHQAVRCLGTLLVLPGVRLQLLQLVSAAAAAEECSPLEELGQVVLMSNSAVGDSAMRALAHACSAPHSGAARLLLSPSASVLLTSTLTASNKRQRLASVCLQHIASAAAQQLAAAAAHHALSASAAAALLPVVGAAEILSTPESVISSPAEESVRTSIVPMETEAMADVQMDDMAMDLVHQASLTTEAADTKVSNPLVDTEEAQSSRPESFNSGHCSGSRGAVDGSMCTVNEAADAAALGCINTEPLRRCVEPLVALIHTQGPCDETRLNATVALQQLVMCEVVGDPTCFGRAIIQAGALEHLRRNEQHHHHTLADMSTTVRAMLTALLTPNSRRAVGSTSPTASHALRRSLAKGASPLARGPSPISQQAHGVASDSVPTSETFGWDAGMRCARRST